LAGAIGPLVVPYSPNKTSARDRFQAPSTSHLFGTDKYGRDVFARVVSAARIDLLIGLGSIVLAFAIGTVIGSMAAYFKGAVDAVLMRIMDMIKAFPQFILGMALVAALGPGVRNLVVVITVIMVPSFARMVRSRIVTLREMPYVDAARTGGVPWWKIIFVYLIPNSLGTLIVVAALNVSYAMLDAAGLSYLGLGVRAPQAEWGMMISEGTKQMLSGYWWISVFPGLALFVSVLGFNLLADGLRDIFDPKMRR
ncbi:MAG: ABC transporter permease, partial [Lentisphaeria bacterium]|nr:ABC transporter permease [Lentisphaeria bacterium]